MDDLHLTTLVYETGSALAQTLVLGMALAAAVRIALSLLAPANAATRFAVWFATLLTIAIMPAAMMLKTSAARVTHQTHAATTLSEPPVTPVRAAAHPPAAVTVAVPAAEPLTATPRSASVAGSWFLVQVPTDDAAGLVVLYLSVVSLLFFRLAVSYLRLRRLKSRTIEPPPEVLSRFASWLELCPTKRPVRLLLSTSARSPMAAGFLRPAIILPDSLLLRLTGQELDHLGLHELAHIRRNDDWTNLTQRILQAAFFFHPAVHWICGQLDFEREVACDDHVLAITGAAKPYANSLAKVLELAPWSRGPMLASGAVFRKRQIFRRVELLFNAARDATPQISPITLAIIALCLFGALSEFVHMPDFIAFGQDHGGNYQRSRWSTDGRTIELEMRGEIQFAGDTIAVQSISPDGFLKVRESGWTRRELELRAADTGPGLKTRYLVDGRERPMDERARQWSADMLAHVIRESGIQAEERALAIYDKRGTPGVLDEVDRIGSDNSRRKYLAAVLLSGRLSIDDQRRVMTRVGRLSSDHEKAGLLLDAAGVANMEDLRSSWFDAVNSIHSDHDRRQVLTKIIEQSGSDNAVLVQVGRSVEQMSSDHDKAEILALPVVRSAANAGSADARRSLLRAAESIQSSHDKANVLSAMLERGPAEPGAIQDIVRVAGTIESDHDRSRVLNGVIARDVPAGPVGEELARTAEKISSDNEKADVLIRLAGQPPSPAFIRAVRSIQSDNDKRRVLEAMLDHNSLESAKQAATLAATIASDNDKAQVLEKIVSRYGGDAEVRDLVRRGAEEISSDTDYRRVISQLLRQPGDSDKAR